MENKENKLFTCGNCHKRYASGRDYK